MKVLNRYLSILLVLIPLATAASTKGNFDEELLQLQKQWALVNYEAPEKSQNQEFESLLAQSEFFVSNYPEKAESWIWLGIIQSSYAGAKGGLGGLSLANKAKQSLEKALELDRDALMGSAYTSLGTLYYKVPGWPIGFGDDDKAKEFLTKALTVNPEGIDPNYFFGEYLYDEGEYSLAAKYLEKANLAKPRVGRTLADKYRHDEVDVLLEKIEKRLRRKRNR